MAHNSPQAPIRQRKGAIRFDMAEGVTLGALKVPQLCPHWGTALLGKPSPYGSIRVYLKGTGVDAF
jgi:hypothetical protein